jgi:hypothetical protein
MYTSLEAPHGPGGLDRSKNIMIVIVHLLHRSYIDFCYEALLCCYNGRKLDKFVWAQNVAHYLSHSGVAPQNNG